MRPILEVDHVSKEYRLGRSSQRIETFREFILRKLHASYRKDRPVAPNVQSFWALQDVSFNVAQGEVVGIIGRNGAGKSTLLKIVSRITDPTSGSITARGRMASLLEVGTGFHPELTGRENIFLNGALLGMRRAEILLRFDEIVEFAEVGKFLDTPVKHYSSGMYVRLAFSVAAHLQPEILIVDEVLAVGDVAFQKKCLGKMSDVSHSGRTVLFVTHNMAAVENLCHRCLVLDDGKVIFDGEAKSAVQQYLNSARTRATDGNVLDLSRAINRRSAIAPLLKRLEFFTDDDQPLTGGISIGARFRLRIHFDLPGDGNSFHVGLGFNNALGQRVFTAHSCFEPDHPAGTHVGTQIFNCEIPSLTFVPGDYWLRIWLDVGSAEADLIDDAAQITVLESDYYGTGKVPWNGAFVLKHHWYLEPPTGQASAALDRAVSV